MPTKNKDEFTGYPFSLISDDIIDQYAALALHQRRIAAGKDGEEIAPVVKKIFKWILYFNSLPENTTIIKEHPLEDWFILDEFKDFIIPNSVRYESGNRIYPDLLVRADCLNLVKKEDFNSYRDLISRFRGFFKSTDNDGKISLSSLRVDKSFEEVRNISAYLIGDDIKCRYMQDRYIPVWLKGVEPIMGPDYANSKTDRIINDYIAELTFGKSYFNK